MTDIWKKIDTYKYCILIWWLKLKQHKITNRLKHLLNTQHIYQLYCNVLFSNPTDKSFHVGSTDIVQTHSRDLLYRIVSLHGGQSDTEIQYVPRKRRRVRASFAFVVVIQWAILFIHDDVIKWKLFPRYRPFVRGIHRSPVNSTHKGQWRGALMFSLICAWINNCVNNREAGDLRRHRAHYDVTVMSFGLLYWHWGNHACDCPIASEATLKVHTTGCCNQIKHHRSRCISSNL